MNPILAVILLSIAGVAGDFCIKLSGNSAKFMDLKWFIPGLFIYVFLSFGWFYVMKNIKLSSLAVVYSLSTVLLLVAIGVFYFHEQLNVQEMVGIVFAILAVCLLSRFI